jgi:hypothetical protein
MKNNNKNDIYQEVQVSFGQNEEIAIPEFLKQNTPRKFINSFFSILLGI